MYHTCFVFNTCNEHFHVCRNTYHIHLQDVECIFGILKARFTGLKTGVQLHGIDACEKSLLKCCALHNIIYNMMRMIQMSRHPRLSPKLKSLPPPTTHENQCNNDLPTRIIQAVQMKRHSANGPTSL
jgi:hypothetical protein